MCHTPDFDRVADVLIEIESRRRQDAATKEGTTDGRDDADDDRVLPSVDGGAG
jgi:hypothetical protein